MTKNDKDRLLGIRYQLYDAEACGLVHPYDYHGGVASFLLRLLDEALANCHTSAETSGKTDEDRAKLPKKRSKNGTNK